MSAAQVTAAYGVFNYVYTSTTMCQNMDSYYAGNQDPSQTHFLYYNNEVPCCLHAKKITIDSSLTTIKNSAFTGCTEVANIDFSAATGLTSIQNYAFKSVQAVTSVDLSATQITSIGLSSFGYCTKLQQLTLPSTVNYLKDSAFWGTNLKKETDVTWNAVECPALWYREG